MEMEMGMGMEMAHVDGMAMHNELRRGDSRDVKFSRGWIMLSPSPRRLFHIGLS